MSDLAFNLNGDSFEVPANAVGWRVRRMKAKGAPEVVYGRNGQPLVVPLEADIDDVRAEVGTAAGRYRFDPVDDSNKPIEGAPAGYIFVHDAGTPAVVAQSTTLGAPSDSIVIEAMRMNAEIARTVIDRFPQMMEAAAVLLRAADGAGLPARAGMAIEEDEEAEEDEADQDEEKRPAGLDVGALLAEAAPLFLAFASGKVKMPDLASMFDWSKAARKGAASRKAQAESAVQASGEAPATTLEKEPTVEKQLSSDPAAMNHFVAIMKQLTPTEAMLAATLSNELSATDRSTWFNALKVMSVTEAANKVRSALVANKDGAP